VAQENALPDWVKWLSWVSRKRSQEAQLKKAKSCVASSCVVERQLGDQTGLTFGLTETLSLLWTQMGIPEERESSVL
jgi:hypothetical protein